MILRKAEWQHSTDVDPAKRRLQSDHATERELGMPNRPAGIGAGREGQDAGGHGRSRSPRSTRREFAPDPKGSWIAAEVGA